jgi:hypothetical protein
MNKADIGDKLALLGRLLCQEKVDIPRALQVAAEAVMLERERCAEIVEMSPLRLSRDELRKISNLIRA